jgi:hypothetical protein
VFHHPTERNACEEIGEKQIKHLLLGEKNYDLENMLNLKRIGSAETTKIQIAGMRVVIRCYMTPV